MRDLMPSHSAPRLALLLWPLLMAVNLAQGESLGGKDLAVALRTGGYVILMRHASSPRTPPDAAHADADNIHVERQLDDTGRTSAQSMGEAMRHLKIPIGKVLSSPTYRALETIHIAKLGDPVTSPELGDSGQSMTPDDSGGRASWLKQRCAERPARGTNTLIVTHFPNITEAYPAAAVGLADGEALILRADVRGETQLVARVKIDEWSTLDRNRP